jgi:beta-glucosidase/6-phospho-beta-glucosidase/beta-galactosidase
MRKIPEYGRFIPAEMDVDTLLFYAKIIETIQYIPSLQVLAMMPPNNLPAVDPLFSLSASGFVWAAGIEDTFIAQTERVGERVLDEYALTNHYQYWRTDLDRAAGLGVNALRYGIPWYKVEPQPGRFDWSWTDQVLNTAAEKGIAIIADLMHYGTPLWLENQFLNSSYPQRVAAYEAEFASRYSTILSHYTPMNEPLITMDFCGERGIWPPYLRGNDGAVKILRQITRGVILSAEAIRQADPRAKIVHVEAAGEYVPDTEEAVGMCDFLTARARLATDLITGRVDEHHPLKPWLVENGFSEDDLAWYRERPVFLDVIGDNYYPDISVHRVRSFNGQWGIENIWGGAEGLMRSVRDFVARYNRPVFISETSMNGTPAQRGRWLDDSIKAVTVMREQNVPLVGYTWWPLFALIDWVYRDGAHPIEGYIARNGPPGLDPAYLSGTLQTLGWNQVEQLPLEAYLAPMGLYELEMQFDGTFARIETPLVDQYRQHIRRFQESSKTIAAGLTDLQ